MTNNNVSKTSCYVYELPYAERNEFCNLMDINDKWKELGGHFMKFDCPTLFKISKAPMRNNSPTDELLTLWGQQNHTILELFKILNEMQHYQAMTILKQFVDPKYHKLIFQGVKSFSNLVNTGSHLQNAIGNHMKLHTDGNLIGNNNLVHKDLNTSDKINERAYSDSPVTLSSAEANTPLITYTVLEQATNYWNKSNILGKGGFGIVFKGIWKNTDVAIKRLESQKGAEQPLNILEAQRKQSLRELRYLHSCRHDNILSLYGFSIGGEKPCLVYQFMSNGSLEDRLQCRQGTKPLPWHIRFQIATGSARGLQFLHGMDKPLIHGDIKSANILLDPYFEPRIGDFGLAREGPLQEYTHVKVSHVHGTRPYLPDEFLRGKKFSTKVDTYSFGVVLFEIATGLRAYDSSRDYKFLKDHVENYARSISDLADVKAGPDENNLFPSLISIGKECVSYKAKDRPEMEQVLRKLDCIMLQERHNSTIRHSLLPTHQYEQMKKISTPSGSYHLQPWLFSPVPSHQLLKHNTSPVPHFGAATVPDQIEGTIMPPIEENNCLLKSTSKLNSERTPDVSSFFSESLSDSQFTNNNNNNNDSISMPQIVEALAQANIETQNSAGKNSISGESVELPLIPELYQLPLVSELLEK